MNEVFDKLLQALKTDVGISGNLRGNVATRPKSCKPSETPRRKELHRVPVQARAMVKDKYGNHNTRRNNRCG